MLVVDDWVTRCVQRLQEDVEMLETKREGRICWVSLGGVDRTPPALWLVVVFLIYIALWRNGGVVDKIHWRLGVLGG